jgi:transposase
MSWHFEFRNVRAYRYLYLVEKRRTPKGPRNVRQIYIGTAESLLRRLASPYTPLRSFPYGTAAALLHAAEKIGLLAALERRLSADARGLSVSRLLFLQIAGRLEHPLSREGMAQWFSSSALPFLWNVEEGPSARTLRRHLQDLFGVEGPDGTILLTRKRVHAIEGEIFRTLIDQGISPKWLLYDGTNFFTFHQADRWFQRGHSKEKRYDRNLLGLGMVTAGTLPVLTEVAPGNEGEAKVFTRIFDAFVQRLIDLDIATDRLTVVFDRGINSRPNFDRVLDAMHVIAALNRQQARRFLRIPLSQFREVAKDGQGEPVLGVSGSWHGFERDWRVLVTYRAATAQHQAKSWADRRAKVLEKVAEWRKHPKRSEKAVWRKLSQVVPETYQTCFRMAVEKAGRGYIPRVEIVASAEAHLVASFGKTAIITDLSKERLSDAELVEGFVARSEIEDDWRWLKDRQVMSVKPVWVWSDVSVPGHVFLCVMGLLLVRYLQWELRKLQLTVKQLLSALDGIKVVLVRTREGKPELALEQMGGLSARVFTKLDLGRYLPEWTSTQRLA